MSTHYKNNCTLYYNALLSKPARKLARFHSLQQLILDVILNCQKSPQVALMQLCSFGHKKAAEDTAILKATDQDL